jgi:hypothetical protein
MAKRVKVESGKWELETGKWKFGYCDFLLNKLEI